MQKRYLIYGLFCFLLCSTSYSQGTWTQKANFGGGNRDCAVGFSIGNKGYIGTGYDNGSFNDFWEYNPGNNTWTQKANFGGGTRYYAIGFSIGNKGYIGTGWDLNGNLMKDFWEYDPIINTWTQKANFGGTARFYAVGFSICNKGYLGTGSSIDLIKHSDFWEYNPITNQWTQKANFGGNLRIGAVGFSIGNKGFIGTGYNGLYLNDFWEYDPLNNNWTQKTNVGGPNRTESVGFSIGNKGYIGTGRYYNLITYNLNDFWEYTPSCDPEISSNNTLYFNNITCNNNILDSLYLKNTGCDTLTISNSSFQGANASEFSLVSPTVPFNINPNDSTMCILQMTSSTVGAKTATWDFHNNTPSADSIWSVSINGRKDTLNFSINNSYQDIRILEFGITCPNAPVEFGLQIQNRSSMATYLSRNEITAPFQIIGTDPFDSIFNLDENKSLIIRFVSADTGLFSQNLVISDSCGYSKTIILKARVQIPNPPDIIGNSTVCSYNIQSYKTSSIGNIYHWSITGGNILGDANRDSIDVLWYNSGIGHLKLVQTNSLGCSDSIQQDIYINSSPQIELVDKITLCADSIYNLNPIITSGIEPYANMKWAPASGLDNPDIRNPRLSLSTPGNFKYYFTVTGANGCVAQDSINITVLTQPQISLNKDSIDFGTLDACQSSKDDTLEITNTGIEDITIDNINQINGFSIVSPTIPFVLKPNWKKKIVIRYSVENIGQVTSDLFISGSPCNFIKSIKLKAKKNQMNLTSSSNNINFGETLSCEVVEKMMAMSITNTGTNDVTLYFDKVELNSPFSLVTPKTSMILSPQNQIYMSINYNPTIVGSYLEYLSIPYETGTCRDTFRISLSGNYIEAITRSNLKDIIFPDIPVSVISKDTIIPIYNSGNNDLIIIGIEPDSIFSINQTNLNIPSGDTKDLEITFSTDIIGSYSAKLIIKYMPCNILDTFSIIGSKQEISSVNTDLTDKTNKHLLSVRPNPTSGDIIIEYKLTENKYTELLFINYLGETVKKILFNKNQESSIITEIMNLDGLSNGEYLLILKTITGVEIQRIVIVK